MNLTEPSYNYRHDNIDENSCADNDNHGEDDGESLDEPQPSPNQKLWKNFLVNLTTTYRVMNLLQMNQNGNTDNNPTNIVDPTITSSTSGGDEQQPSLKQQQPQQPTNIRLMVYDLKNEIGDNSENSGSGNRFNHGHHNNNNNWIDGNRFRKTWGNFVNFYDEQGKQKLFIKRKQLTNYFILANCVDPGSKFKFFATLFTNGNYPKTLYSGTGNSWRMRYNIFASGVKPELCEDGQYVGDSSHQDYDDDEDEDIIHIGELHLYFHVEQNKPEPLYQNICFFYNQSINSVIEKYQHHDEDPEQNKKFKKTLKKKRTNKKNVDSEEEDEDDHHLGNSLIRMYHHLRTELSNSLFIEQLFFPIESNRFQVSDKTVDYFVLRQQDLAAAIKIANHKNILPPPNHLQTNRYNGNVESPTLHTTMNGMHSFLFRPKKYG